MEAILININIIVAFPKIENGKSIKNILVKHGFCVSAVCTTGAQILQHADMLEHGIVVCSSRLKDMIYNQVYEYLPSDFEMLVIASQNIYLMKQSNDHHGMPQRVWDTENTEHIVFLSMPLKVHELVSTMEMMAYSLSQRKKKKKPKQKERSEEEKKIIQKAKELLMARNHMTEEEAHHYIQRCSMDSGTGLTETAQMILSMIQG